MEITNQLLAAYAEGNVTEAERSAVCQYLAEHSEELESVMIMMDRDYDIQLEERHHSDHSRGFDLELDDLLNEIDSSDSEALQPTSANVIPILSKAAQNNDDNLCAIRCEGYALRALGIEITDEALKKEAKELGLIKSEGTLLHDIGLLSAKHGLFVSRRYECKISDILKALKHGDMVIAVIDSTELSLEPEESERRDEFEGKRPNHAVIVKAVDVEENYITLLNPGISDDLLYYPLDVFIGAWNDSANYLIISNRRHYKPHPLNMSDVPLEEGIMELREALAENVHEVWAQARKEDGWTYGTRHDDAEKTDPNLLPYDLLPEKEKETYRKMAVESIKILKKIGWSLKKE